MAGALNCRLADLAEGLDPDHKPDRIEHINALMDCDGALEMLEAYAALPNNAFRRAVLHHARNLADAAGSERFENGAKASKA
jgi:hypothetical protein